MAQRPQKRQRLLISGSYHSELGEKVARTLSAQLTICDLSKMANGETMVNIEVFAALHLSLMLFSPNRTR